MRRFGHWKERYWVCKKCGTVYRRYKKDRRRILHCGLPMHSARKYPDQGFFAAIQKKEDRKYREAQKLAKKYNRVWNSEGHILQVSKESRAIWQRMSHLKQKPAFIRYGHELLLSLRKDLGRLGRGGVPEIRFQTLSYELGVYHRSLIEGVWEIKLDPSRNLAEIMDTFLHEVLHWIDDQSRACWKFGKLPHGHFQFEERLFDLKQRLGYFKLANAGKLTLGEVNKLISKNQLTSSQRKAIAINLNKEANMAKGKTKAVESKAEKAEKKSKQAARREEFFAKYETQIREYFSKDKATVAGLKKTMGIKDQAGYLDLLWCRNKIKAEKK